MLAEAVFFLNKEGSYFLSSFLFMTFLTLTNKRYLIATVKIKTIYLHSQLRLHD